MGAKPGPSPPDMAGSVGLSAPSAPVTPSGGNVVLTIPGPFLGRVWQGTIVIPNAPSSSVWALAIGGFVYANLLGNGPFGPMQVGYGQSITLTGAGTGSAQLVAYILGVDDPASASTPYTGPAALPSPGAPALVTITGQPIMVNPIPAGPFPLDVQSFVTSGGAIALPTTDAAHRWRVWLVFGVPQGSASSGYLTCSITNSTGTFVVSPFAVSGPTAAAGYGLQPFNLGPAGMPLSPGAGISAVGTVVWTVNASLESAT